jgi:hypothetical protein
MTLKEKLFNVIFDNLWEHKESNIVPEVEKIADEFAIGFAEWCGVPIVDANVKELLEIYKKEKGL